MKYFYLLITTTVFIVSINLNAQNPTFTWGKKFATQSGASSATPLSVIFDGSGNVYTTGNFVGTVDFDPGAGVFNLVSNGSNDIFITKLDVNGNFVWAKSIGGSASDYGKGIALDGSGNIYLTGYYSNITVDFDPGIGVFNLSNLGGQDIFILKLDNGGNFVWAKQFGNSNSVEEGNSIAIDVSGNVYTTGFFQGTMDFDPGAGVFNLSATPGAFVSKLDMNGNFVLAKEISSARGQTVKLDASNNIFIGGHFSGTGDFDPSISVYNLTSFGSNDVFVLKLNSIGNFVFAKQLGGTSTDEGWGLDLDNAGNIIIAGAFQGTSDFDPGAGVFNLISSGSMDCYACKLSSIGNFVWAKAWGSTGFDRVWSITTDVVNNIYTGGFFQGTVDFDPNTGSYTLTASVGSDGFVSKLDVSGNLSFAGQVGGSAGEAIYVVKTDPNSNLFVGGDFGGTSDIDLTLGTFTLSAIGQDGFLSKYLACTIPSQPLSIYGPSTMCSGIGTISYSISPVIGATSYTWSLPAGWSGSSSSNTISATPGITGIFTVTATNACGTSPQQTLAVTVNPSPTISVNSGSICAGHSFTMSPGGANTYTIQGGSAVVSPTATTSYTIVGTSTAGCVSSSPATSNVTVNPLPTIGASTSNTMLCIGQSATLTASGASSFTFNPGGTSASIVVSPSITSTYTISGTSTQGCNNSTVFTQSVSTCAGIEQIITQSYSSVVFPNPSNGKFTIKSINLIQNIEVLNLLGEIVLSKVSNSEIAEIDITEQVNGVYILKIDNKIQLIIKQ